MVDEEEVCEMYMSQTTPPEPTESACQSPTISLLLFRSMLFAASTFAPVSVLQKAGYKSRRAARQSMFSKVRALYSLDVERDEITLLQSFLLMSHWRDSSDDSKDAWYWCGLALDQAFKLGLHREPVDMPTERSRTMRKRLWWCCVARDRILALYEHRTPRIRLEESNVPKLTLGDYNVGLRSPLSDISLGEELGKRTAVTMFSMHQMRLVACISPGSSAPSAAVPKPDNLASESGETWARPRKSGHANICATGVSELDSWRRNLPEVLQHPQNAVADDAVLACIMVHRNTLQLYYHKIIQSIFMSRLMSTPGDATSSQQAMELLRRSSARVGGLYEELADRDLTHFLPGEYLEATNQINWTPMNPQGFGTALAPPAPEASLPLGEVQEKDRTPPSVNKPLVLATLPSDEQSLSTIYQSGFAISGNPGTKTIAAPDQGVGGTDWATGDLKMFDALSSGVPGMASDTGSSIGASDFNISPPAAIFDMDFLLPSGQPIFQSW